MISGEPIFINKGSKIGILMLHGFSSTPAQFKQLSDYLAAKGFNVYAPLIAGHGTTPQDFKKTTPKDWTKSTMDAYIKLKNISEEIFIIGNSFGSNLGLWLVRELNNEPVGIITLGAPIFLRLHNLVKFRLFTYGRFKKYYKKPAGKYGSRGADKIEEISYAKLPIKTVKEFINFLEKDTRPNLCMIKLPILIASSKVDPIIDPKSVKCIFENVGSPKKEIFWFDNPEHDIVGKGCEGLFEKIFEFIKKTAGSPSPIV